MLLEPEGDSLGVHVGHEPSHVPAEVGLERSITNRIITLDGPHQSIVEGTIADFDAYRVLLGGSQHRETRPTCPYLTEETFVQVVAEASKCQRQAFRNELTLPLGDRGLTHSLDSQHISLREHATAGSYLAEQLTLIRNRGAVQLFEAQEQRLRARRVLPPLGNRTINLLDPGTQVGQQCLPRPRWGRQHLTSQGGELVTFLLGRAWIHTVEHSSDLSGHFLGRRAHRHVLPARRLSAPWHRTVRPVRLPPRRQRSGCHQCAELSDEPTG